MTTEATSTRRLPVRRILLLAALAATVVALLPLAVSTLALLVASGLGCDLGGALASACSLGGTDLHPFLTHMVTLLDWSDVAWDAGLIALLLWILVFVIGLGRDIRLLRRPDLPAAQAAHRRSYLLIPLTGATLIGFGPVLWLCWAMMFASVFGCQLDEGSVHPCLVAGVDYGGVLTDVFVLGWLMLLVWPVALIALAGWIAAIASALRRRRATQRPIP